MNPTDPPQPVAFCPYCGQALGWFFGARVDGDAVVCDRCGECFRVTRVEIDETD
jgi:hypothetical protein